MRQKLHIGLLILTALIWGIAFVAQSTGAEYVGPFTFLASRNYLACLALVPFLIRREIDPQTRRNTIKYGLICGAFLCLGSLFQQMGIAYTTTAKSGFITAMYMVIVPVISIFLGKKPSKKLWISVLLGIVGLYLLCLYGHEAMSLGKGEAITLLCSFAFACQILSVNHFGKDCDSILLSEMQFIVCAIVGTVCMFFEQPTLTSIQLALPAILYAGLFSSGIGYTLQIIGQEGVNPTLASLILCLESVFSALAGWLLLGQTLTATELLGCATMFGAIILTQIGSEVN